MTGTDLLHSIAATLEAAGIPFMLTGSMASAYHGTGRATMDIDLVIDPTRKQLDGLVERVLTAGLYISPEAAHGAFDRCRPGAVRRAGAGLASSNTLLTGQQYYPTQQRSFARKR